VSTAIVLDTETTGVDQPDVIQLAYTEPLDSPFARGNSRVLMFRPTKPMQLGALATHHIIESDLEGRDPWPGRWDPPAGTEYIVGHSVDFDWRAIGEPNVKRICTLALARQAWPDLDSHSLGALTYYLLDHRAARELLKGAHDAHVDVSLCHRVLLALIDAAGAKTWPDLWSLSEYSRYPQFMTFGKFGPDSDYAKSTGGPMPCADVRRLDFGYYRWLFDKCDQVRDDVYLQAALRGEAPQKPVFGVAA
jgi:exodeoxyribonuclease X